MSTSLAGKSKREEKRGYHMPPEEFRRRGKALIDWVASYHERLAAEGADGEAPWPVKSRVKPGEVRAKLPAKPPHTGEPFENLLKDLEEIVLPGICHWQSPNFFAYFPSNNSGPSILGDLASSGLGVQGMLWATSPACTELETHVLDWLVEMLGLPERFLSSGKGGGVIQDTASSAALAAIVAARERATQGITNAEGCDGRLVAYTSVQAHSSIEKDVKIAGIGARNLRAIEVDEKFALRPEALARQIAEDRKAGRLPFFVCATVGTTSTTAIDPVRAIGEICRRENLWLHVDAAMAGTAALCPEFRWIHGGLDLADSYCFNPHKWMFTNFDCTVFYVADRKALVDSLSILPEYLRTNVAGASPAGEVFDYRDWHVPLGRRFRALKLWFVIRHYGVEGLRHHVRRHVELAHELADRVQEDARFELMAPVPLNLVCFRLKADDAKNEELLNRLNASGKIYLSHTKLDGKFTLRLCVAQTKTQERHVQRAWRLIQETASKLV